MVQLSYTSIISLSLLLAYFIYVLPKTYELFNLQYFKLLSVPFHIVSAICSGSLAQPATFYRDFNFLHEITVTENANDVYRIGHSAVDVMNKKKKGKKRKSSKLLHVYIFGKGRFFLDSLPSLYEVRTTLLNRPSPTSPKKFGIIIVCYE